MSRLICALFMTVWMNCCLAALGAESSPPITFDEHIAPIFKRHCWQCHGDAKQEGGLNLASYAAAIKGSSGGVVVISGRSSTSRLFQAITAEDAAERMPPENDSLPKEQIALIKAWIDSGLRQNAGSAATPPRTLSFIPASSPANLGQPAMPEKLPVVPASKTIRPFPVLALAASPRAPLIAVAGYERVDFVDPVTQSTLGSLRFPEGEPQVLRFSRSGAILLVAGWRPVQNGSVVLCDVRSGRRLAELGNESDTVLAADIAADERHVAIGGAGRVVKVFSTVDGHLRHTLVKHTDWITAIAYSPDGKLLASGDRVGNIHLWDANNGGVVLPLSEHKAAVRSLAWRSDSQVLASCSEDGQVIWWDVSKGWPVISKADAHLPVRPAGVYGKLANGVLDANFGPQGELVTCGRDCVVRLWASDGRLLSEFKLQPDTKMSAPSAAIRSFPLRSVVTANGLRVVAGDSAGRIFSWPVSTDGK